METNLHNYLQGIADAIKEKTGDTTINAQDFASKIASIEAGGGGDSNALVEAILGRTLTEYVSDSSADIGNYAFQGCKYLEKLDMPNLLSIGTGACYQCTKLKNINLPSLKYGSSQTFYGCTAIVEVTLPKLTELSNAIFQNCTALTKIELGNVCKKIGSSFINCSNLTTVIINYPQLCSLGNTNAFLNTPIAGGTGYVYVPDDLVETYKGATNWLTYASQIKGLSELPQE